MSATMSEKPGASGPFPAFDPSAAPASAVLVLDTNVALDVLAFGDPRSAALTASLTARTARWLASAYMRREFEHVLQRPIFAARGFDTAAILARYESLVEMQPDAPPGQTLRCRDAADQPFLDLALAAGAAWLLTHDKDLLSLSRHAARRGLRIATPLAWAQPLLERQQPAPPAEASAST